MAQFDNNHTWYGENLYEMEVILLWGGGGGSNMFSQPNMAASQSTIQSQPAIPQMRHCDTETIAAFSRHYFWILTELV